MNILPRDQQIAVIGALSEGMSIRSVERLTGIHRDTIMRLGARIGRGAILNSNCTVEHDTQIGDWVHVAPGVTISGGVTVGPLSMIGVGAVIIEGKRIANGCIIGAGAVVVHDLTEPGVYVGCPARRIR